MTETMPIQWWPAPAKLNLFLHIVGRRADGYHLLQTVFQLIELGDRLHFDITEDGQISRESDLPGVNASDDLVVRAACQLQKISQTKLGVRIHVDKVLPMGGGLAGGSTDAATTLVALNKLWGCGLTQAELGLLGAKLGADVPVFIHGHTAWAEGIGEQLTSLTLPEAWFVVLKPDVSVNTGEIFRSTSLRRDCSASTIRDFLAAPNAMNFTNVCEPVVRARYPEIEAALDDLAEFAPSALTGTGACVFARFDTVKQAQVAMDKLSAKWQGWVTKGINESPLLDL